MIRIIIIRNLTILKGEIMTFHYMVMANHAIYNRMLMEILTQKGRQQQQRVMEALQNIEEQTFDGMPEEEVEQFMELYGKIHRRLTDRPMK